MIKSLIYQYVRYKKNNLKLRIDARGKMLWMGPPPKLLSANDLEVGDVVFCGSATTDKT
jgi:hypothetical protein